MVSAEGLEQNRVALQEDGAGREAPKDNSLDEYLNKPIKELISRFPGLDKVLEEYEIGCVPCQVGTCLLKDIVEIHNLPEQEEQELMAKIAGVLFPKQLIRIPRTDGREKTPPQAITYSPPLKMLVDEHTLIKRCLAVIPRLLEQVDAGSRKDREVLHGLAHFIQSYADRFHHAKEEDILFPYFDENSEVLMTMMEDHRRGRGHVQGFLESLSRNDAGGIALHLSAYRDLLAQHIRREDEILYPWMDRNLSDREIGELFSKFNEVDEMRGGDLTEGCRGFVSRLETTTNSQKEKVR